MILTLVLFKDMDYIRRRIKRSDLVEEIVFDFEDSKTRVEGDRVFLKIKECTVPLNKSSKITFVKTLNYSSDTSNSTIQKTFDVLSIEDNVVEIENPLINYLYCKEYNEYSFYDKEIDENTPKSFNYIPTGYTNDYNYFILDFENEHYIAENESFNLRVRKSSPWANNGFSYYNTIDDLPAEGKENRLYVVRFVGEEVEEKNVVKYWDNEGKKYMPQAEGSGLSETEINNRLKDLEMPSTATYFYKHYETYIDGKKLQLELDNEYFYEWSYDFNTCKMDVVYTINGEKYDDRIFFKESGSKIILSNNVSANTASEFLNFKIHMNESQGSGLFQETILKSEYVDDVINSAIPDINDFEKNVLKPFINRGGGKISKASRLIFNLHFRDRVENGNVTENWTTDDSKKWNGGDSMVPDKSDLLWYLGFDKDDVYFQKMKLQKSFLRLSFYDSNDPMNQNLLFYSTIFLDTGELFGKYNKLKTQATEGEISGVDSESDVMLIDKDGFDRLDCQFVVTDRYNINKSSEGFYIYLFNKTLPKKAEEPIYMKVEFNHAKYGKTIPFLYFPDKPRDSYLKEVIQGDIKSYFVDMDSYFKDLYIELRVKYNEETRSYMYYLPQTFSGTTTDIIFNLYEPRING